MARVLVLDDDQDFLQAATDLLGALGHEVNTANSLGAGELMVKANRFDHLLIDLMLPDGSGLQLLDALSERQRENTKVTVITGHPSIKQSVKSLYGPGVNYLIKPLTLDALKDALTGEAQPIADTPETTSSTKKSVRPSQAASSIEELLVGESSQMQHLRATVKRVAATDANVMLMGESGAGKEVVAQAIHQLSRAQQPFIATNCGAMHGELINSELFGHEKGAFTGALARKPGVFEQAGEGTLFLDEITEMPLELQTTLLRVLETRTLVRVGGQESIATACRVISATNRSEAAIARDKCLREDVYFRLAVFPIHIPPLRDRDGDIPILANHFVAQLNQEHDTHMAIDSADMKRLEAYSWPGNVRELRHCIHRAFIMTDPQSRHIEIPERLGSPFAQTSETQEPGDFALKPGQSIEQMEKALIEMTLDKLGGDKTRAAKMLGVSTKTLYNRLKAYENEPQEPE